jgi:hypothetical protein
VTGESKEDQKNENMDTDSVVRCPLFRIPEIKCIWRGNFGHLKRHFKAIHDDIQKKCCWVICKSLTNNVLILSCYEDIFIYYKHVTVTGVMYVAVQQVGITNRNFIYTIQLFSQERIKDNINFSFRVTKVLEPLEDILSHYKCMAIDNHRLKPFIDNGLLAMSLKIRPVFKLKRKDITETNVKKGLTSGTNQEQKRKEDEETVNCPLFKIPDIKCSWSGVPHILVKHLEAEHGNIVIRGPDFDCRHVENNAFIIFFNGEMFLYYKYISYTSLYAVVQQVGTNNQKYTYRIELTSTDEEVDDITFHLQVNTISIPFEAVFDARECMALTIDSLEPFVVNRKLNMKVKIRGFDAKVSELAVPAEKAKDEVGNTAIEEHYQESGKRNG